MHTDVICLLINYPPEVVGEGRGLGVCWLCHDDIFLIPLFFLVSVFFTASYAEISLVNFTDCTLTEYLCDTRKCMTQFIKNVQNDPKGDCG